MGNIIIIELVKDSKELKHIQIPLESVCLNAAVSQ